MENHLIIKYLSYAEKKIKSQIDNPELDENIKKSLSSKIDNLLDLKEKIDFQLKSPDEKQASRIEWIASLRKRGNLKESRLKAISLYDKIRETLPYLEVLNRNDRLKDLIDLCHKELELIDFSGLSFGDNHISLDLISPLFESLLKTDESSIHPEAIVKIRELFEEFKEVLTT